MTKMHGVLQIQMSQRDEIERNSARSILDWICAKRIVSCLVKTRSTMQIGHETLTWLKNPHSIILTASSLLTFRKFWPIPCKRSFPNRISLKNPSFPAPGRNNSTSFRRKLRRRAVALPLDGGKSQKVWPKGEAGHNPAPLIRRHFTHITTSTKSLAALRP